MKDSYTFIVVGGGIAGVSCVESLPFWAESETVLLISDSPYVKRVSRDIPLTKTLSDIEVEEETVGALNERCSSIDIVIADVVSVDSEQREVVTNKGQRFKYKRLCIATGAKPKLIVEDNPYVLGIRDTDSVSRLIAKLKDARRLMIVGNGGIASELVYEITGLEKIWVVKDKHISSTFLDEHSAGFLKEALLEPRDQDDFPDYVVRMRYTADSSSRSALGPDWLDNFNLAINKHRNKLKIEFGTTIANIETNPDAEYPLRVTLENGKIYHCNIIVSATGVSPRGDAIRVLPTPLELADDGGIVVDEKLSSSVAGIYAAGDVATAGWQKTPYWHQMRTWLQARQMGHYAAKAMALELRGEPVLQDFCFEIFSHITNLFGYKVIILGDVSKDDGCSHEMQLCCGHSFVKLVQRDGKLQGAVLIGETDMEEMCENLILNQLYVGDINLFSRDVDVEDFFD